MLQNFPSGWLYRLFIELANYKKILKNILVPSLFVLLFQISAILSSYGFFLGSRNELFPGFVILIISIILGPLILRSSVARDNEKPPDYKNPDSGCSRHTETKEISRRKSYAVLLLFSVLIFTVTVLKIHSIISYNRQDGNCALYHCTVREANSLRYNRELRIEFSGDKCPNSGSRNTNRGVIYLPPGSGVNTGDEIDLFTKPEQISPEQYNKSGFHLGLVRSGIRFIAYLEDGDFKIIRRSPESVKSVIKTAIEKNIDRLFRSSACPVIKALYFGNSSVVDKLTILEFKRAGVLHILAASGFNIGIIAAIPYFILSLFRINKKIILTVSLALVCFYLYITDMPVSLLRAFIMFLIYAIQQVFDLDKNIMNTLFISAIIILLVFPYELYNMGFQLTYGATAGIIMLYRFYRPVFFKLPSFIAGSLSLTLSAQALVFPIILCQMGEVNLIGIISNLLLIPGMSIVFVISIASNVLSPCHPASSLLAAITGSVSDFNLFFIRLLSGQNGHFNAGGSGYMLILPYVLYFFPVFPLGKLKKFGAWAVFMAFMISFLILSNKTDNGARQIIFNSNESNILIYAENYHGLIYGTLSINDCKKLLKILNDKGISAFQLCIPKPDFKNLSAYTMLIKKSAVTQCIIGPGFKFSADLKKFCKILDKDRVPLQVKPLRDLSLTCENSTESSILYVRSLFIPQSYGKFLF